MSGSRSWLAALLEMVYGWLLACYPADVRRRFSEDMLVLFRDLCEAEHVRRGWTGVALLSLRSYVDALREAALAHRDRWVESRRENGPAIQRMKEAFMLRGLFADVVYAFRMMGSRRGFTVVVVLTLAVGIGATTAMFGTINRTLLGSLTFDEADRLVMGRATFDGSLNPYVSGYDYYDYREQSQSFESIAAIMSFADRVTVLGEAEPERATCDFVTWDLFPTLRIRPVLGRLFAAEEGVEGGPSVVMISYGYWQRRFGGASDALGSTLIISGIPYTVVGVMPAGFHFLNDVDIWRLTYYNGPGAEARRWHDLLVVGRLKPGVTLEQAQSEVDGISRRLEQQYPETNEGKALLLTDLHEAMVEDVRTGLVMLMAAVSLVLLLACANVAGLLLARGQSRLKEIAIRTAMGASRRRLIRQLLTESTLTAVVAGLLGVVLAGAFQDLLIRLLPVGQLGITEASFDPAVLSFALGVSIATGVIFGVVPALHGTLVESSRELSAGIRATSGRRTSVLRSGLIVLQVALSTVLLIGAGLLLRSLALQMDVDLGFNPQHLLTAELNLPSNAYPEAEQRIAFYSSFAGEVEALPGVDSVGLVSRLPIRGIGGNRLVAPPDQPPEVAADYRYMLPGYLKAMGIPLLAGRDVAESDVEGAPRVMVISEALAERFFPGENPLGQKLMVDLGEMVAHEVVGVAGNARLWTITRQNFLAMYVPYYQDPRNLIQIAVRSRTDPSALIPSVREVLRAKDRNIPLAEPATMESIIESSLADYRVVTLSLGLFSSIALLLALVGLYGALAYYVSQRYHEIGVRMALGAGRRQLANLILSRGMGMVSIGLALGLVGSYWATDLIQRLLYGVEPNDPATFAVAALSFGATALMACLLPAWRATRVDPVTVLQAE